MSRTRIGGVILVRKHHIVPWFCAQQLVVDLDGETLLLTVDGSLRLVDRRIGDDATNIFQAHPDRSKFGRIDLDPHRMFLHTADIDQANFWNLRNLLYQDIVGRSHLSESAAKHPTVSTSQ